MNTSRSDKDSENLNLGQRVLELIFTVLMVFLLGFFVYHQQTNSGYFTEKYGALEMLCLYVPIALAISAMLVRVWTGQRQPARPLEVLRNLLLGLGSLWLLTVFPFNFTHLADTLPEAMRFVLGWLTNDMGRILLILQIVIGPITALVTAWQYMTLRHRDKLSHSNGTVYHSA